MNTSMVEVAQGSTFLTPQQFASECQLSLAKVYLMLKSGAVPSIKIDRCRRIPRTALTTLLQAQQQSA